MATLKANVDLFISETISKNLEYVKIIYASGNNKSNLYFDIHIILSFANIIYSLIVIILKILFFKIKFLNYLFLCIINIFIIQKCFRKNFESFFDSVKNEFIGIKNMYIIPLIYFIKIKK